MKKILYFLFAAIALFTAASCTKDVQPVPDGERVVKLILDNSEATKASMGGVNGRTPQWEIGDQIWISNGTDPAQTLTLAAGDIVDNVAVVTTSLAGTLYAVYPASAATELDGTKIGFKIPTSTDGSVSKAHIAVAEGTTTLNFKNVVSILKIETAADTKGINIATTTANISGDFKVTYSSLAIEAGTNQYKGVNLVSSSAGVKYVAVASGTAFNDMKFTVIKNDNSWATKTSSQSTFLAANSLYNMGALSTWSLTYDTSGSLYGLFSVAAGKQVHFARGNMYWDGTAYQLEAKQYDYRHYNGITDDSAVINGVPTTTPSGTVGSFWRVKNDETSIHPYDQTYGTPSPAETNTAIAFPNDTEDTPNSAFTANGVTNRWRLLSGGTSVGEYYYLTKVRTGFSNKLGRATVGGVKGLIILPDEFVDPMTNGSSSAFVTIATNGFDANIYTAGANWDAMEIAGAVFLPAIGRRADDIIYPNPTTGYYLSSSPYWSDYAYYLNFGEDYYEPGAQTSRSTGFSIRLVLE